MEALKAAGLGKQKKLWLHIIYNEDYPMRRTAAVNGLAPREIPECCLLSPLAFLFVAEALNRVVVQDANIQGIRIVRREHQNISSCWWHGPPPRLLWRSPLLARATLFCGKRRSISFVIEVCSHFQPMLSVCAYDQNSNIVRHVSLILGTNEIIPRYHHIIPISQLWMY